MSRGGWAARASSRSSSRPLAVAVDDALLEPFLDGLGARLLFCLLLLAVGVERDVGVQGIVPVAPAVEDQVLGRQHFFFGDGVQGHDPGHVQNGPGHAALQGVVQEHRVEHVAGRRLEAEGYVRQPEHDLAFGQGFGDGLDAVEGGKAQTAVVVVARADGKRQGIDQQVRRWQPVAFAGELVKPPGDAELAGAILGHAVLVDGQRHHRGPEAARQLQALSRRLLAVLEVDGVDDGLAAVELERRLDDADLGGIDDQRRRHRTAHA